MNANQWIEQFTGLKLADGSASGPDPLLAAQAQDEEAALKKAMLDAARIQLSGVKQSFQKAMAHEVKVKGAFFKQKMLEIDGTQIDEAEFEEIDFQAMQKHLSPEAQKAIEDGKNVIINEHGRLKAARVDRNGKNEPLFTKRELQDEYWFPLTRERILPETFVAGMYSKTQQMLDQTNAHYHRAVEVKRKKGELTPKANRVRDLVQTGADLASAGASVAGAFGAGSEQAALAKNILNLMGDVIEGGGEVYDKVMAKEYTDASTLFLDNVSLITVFALKQAGVSKEVIDAAKAGFKAGATAIKAGQKFSQGVEGATGGVELLADVFGGVFDIAAGQVSNPNDRASLLQCGVYVSTSMKGAAITADVALKLKAGDPEGVVDCLTRYADTAINTAQGLKKIEAVREKGNDKDGAKDVGDAYDKQTKSMLESLELADMGAKAVVTAAILVKKGAYKKAFDTLVLTVGAGLTKTLEKAGVPEDQSRKIGLLYNSAVSGMQVLDALLDSPPNVAGALNSLGGGIESAFAGAAPGNQALQAAGAGLAQGLGRLVDVGAVVSLYREKKYEEGLQLFLATAEKGVLGAFKIKGIVDGEAEEDESEDDGDDDQDESDSAPSGLKEQLGGLMKALVEAVESAKPEIAEKIDDALEDAVEKVAGAEARAEADAILEEAQADMARMNATSGAQLTEAEKLSREAADIDKLIAKMQRDQLVMRIAQQMLDGGTAFLASFLPGLGAVNAGLKMAASMLAAGQRAQQLYLWTESRRDFAAAQSALTSSAQNFVKNQRDQFAHHSIQAAFQGAKLIANAMEVAGAAGFGAGVAAGQGLKIASEVGLKLEEIIQRHKKTEELEYGWRITKASLKNPTNRKLGLRARELNPTLAKYSIAWGAVNKNDALARNALRACNLTEAVLESPNANVDKVVEYLETFYHEDDQLYREVETAAPWVPTDVELTLRSWTRLKKLAIDNIKLENPDTGNIDGLLVQVKGDVSKMDEEAAGERIALLTDIDHFLGAYQPKAKDTKSTDVFKKVVQILRNQAAGAIKVAEGRVLELTEHAERLAEEARKKKAAREELLKDAMKVVGELNVFIGVVERFTSEDGPEDLRAGFDEANELIRDIEGVPAFKQDKLLQSTLKQLQGKLLNLERLVDMSELAQVA